MDKEQRLNKFLAEHPDFDFYSNSPKRYAVIIKLIKERGMEWAILNHKSSIYELKKIIKKRLQTAKMKIEHLQKIYNLLKDV